MIYTAAGLALIALAAVTGVSLGSARKRPPETFSAVDDADEFGVYDGKKKTTTKMKELSVVNIRATKWREEDEGHLYPIIAAGGNKEDADAEYEDEDAEEIGSIALASKGPSARGIN